MGGFGGGSDARDIAHITLGVLGNIASCLFFLSSAPTIIRLVRCKTSGGISGDLYAFKLLNCMLWCLYGIPYVHPDDFWVVLTNAFGCAFSLIYIFAYLWVATTKEKIGLLWKLCAMISSFVILVVLLVELTKSHGSRILVVGIICAIVSSAMHMALLFQCRMAIESKDKEYLHPNASLAAFLKGAIWTAYGIVKLDVFILIPNGVGVIIGILQVMLVLLLINHVTPASTTPSPHSKDTRKEDISQDVKIHCESLGVDSSRSIGSGITPLASVSRVSSLLGLSRQGSLSSSVVVPIGLDDDSVPDQPQKQTF